MVDPDFSIFFLASLEKAHPLIASFLCNSPFANIFTPPFGTLFIIFFSTNDIGATS